MFIIFSGIQKEATTILIWQILPPVGNSNETSDWWLIYYYFHKFWKLTNSHFFSKLKKKGGAKLTVSSSKLSNGQCQFLIVFSQKRVSKSKFKQIYYWRMGLSFQKGDYPILFFVLYSEIPHQVWNAWNYSIKLPV